MGLTGAILSRAILFILIDGRHHEGFRPCELRL